MPNIVTDIGESAFYESNSLASINLANGITKIKDYTFYNRNTLKSIVIPENVTISERMPLKAVNQLKNKYS